VELCLECWHRKDTALLHHITAVHSWTDTVVACQHHPASVVLKKLGEDCADCGVCSWCPPYTIGAETSIIIHQSCCIAMHVSMWLAVSNFLVECSRKRTSRSEGIIQQWVGGVVTFRKCGNTWDIIMDVSKKYWNINYVASSCVCEKICQGFQCIPSWSASVSCQGGTSGHKRQLQWHQEGPAIAHNDHGAGMAATITWPVWNTFGSTHGANDVV